MQGVLVCSATLVAGAVLGAGVGRFVPQRVKDVWPVVFGVALMGIGATLVGRSAALHVVVLALVLGTALGELVYMEHWVGRGVMGVMRLTGQPASSVENNAVMLAQYMTLISMFCFGSMGIFGALSEGATGNPGILLTKAVIDFFTALAFGATLGLRVCFIVLPQLVILTVLYFSGAAVMPLATPAMLNDFSACGGVIFIATGLRLGSIKMVPVINMIPSLVLVGPFSWLAGHFL